MDSKVMSDTPTDENASMENYNDLSDDSVDYNEKDPFYDEDMDDEDARFVQRMYMQHQIVPKVKTSGDTSEQKRSALASATPAPSSDAVLSCPSCFTIVCYDCQQHATYKTQFRAMFVSNVTILRSRRAVDYMEGLEDTSTEKPVVCNECYTVLAAYDNDDEIYHFFSAVPSNAS